MSKPATCKFTPFLLRCRVACEPERHYTQESGRHLLQKNAKMMVETVETVVAAAPYTALIGHKCDRCCRTANQRSLIVKKTLFKCATSFHEMENFPCMVRLTKSFPTIPNLRGITNANQNDERFKMWSVMLLCTIVSPPPLLYASMNYVYILVATHFCRRVSHGLVTEVTCLDMCTSNKKKKADLKKIVARKATQSRWLRKAAISYNSLSTVAGYESMPNLLSAK